jgi:hypothetical protein
MVGIVALVGILPTAAAHAHGAWDKTFSMIIFLSSIGGPPVASLASFVLLFFVVVFSAHALLLLACPLLLFAVLLLAQQVQIAHPIFAALSEKAIQISDTLETLTCSEQRGGSACSAARREWWTCLIAAVSTIIPYRGEDDAQVR